MTAMSMADFPDTHPEAALTDGITLRRLGGWLADAIILTLILGLLKLALWILGYVTFGLGWYLLGGLWIVPIAYIFVFVASPAQATPGQALAGIQVVRDIDLGRPTPAQALVYALLYAVTMAAGAVWLAAAFFTRRARCLHDILAGVAVLRADALGALPAPLGIDPGPGGPGSRDGWAFR